MPPKLINCSGCLSKHARPSCLWRYKTSKSDMGEKGTPFTQQEYQAIFGEDGVKGIVPERDTDEYLAYIEQRMLSRQQELVDAQKANRRNEVESQLRRLSISGATQSPGLNDTGVSGSGSGQGYPSGGSGNNSPHYTSQCPAGNLFALLLRRMTNLRFVNLYGVV